jgi:hypothetical protein
LLIPMSVETLFLLGLVESTRVLILFATVNPPFIFTYL